MWYAPGKRKDLRMGAVEEEEPERIWVRICVGRQFHKRGPAKAKAHCCNVDVFDIKAD